MYKISATKIPYFKNYAMLQRQNNGSWVNVTNFR